MLFNSLLARTIAKKGKINQPTDLLKQHNYILLDELLIEKYGLFFATFLSKIVTKYQALEQSENFKGGEFWWTGTDITKTTGLSYHIHRKMIKQGEELGLWTCTAKFNPTFPGHHINKTNHFTINWDALSIFIYELNKKKDIAQEDIEIQENEAQEEEILRVEDEAKKSTFALNEKEILEYAKIMSSQNGVRVPKSYKLQIILNAYNGHKKTLERINLWKQLKTYPNNNQSSIEELKYIKYKYFYQDNQPYKIIDLVKNGDIYMVSGILQDKKENTVVFIEYDYFEAWKKELNSSQNIEEIEI